MKYVLDATHQTTAGLIACFDARNRDILHCHFEKFGYTEQSERNWNYGNTVQQILGAKMKSGHARCLCITNCRQQQAQQANGQSFCNGIPGQHTDHSEPEQSQHQEFRNSKRENDRQNKRQSGRHQQCPKHTANCRHGIRRPKCPPRLALLGQRIAVKNGGLRGNTSWNTQQDCRYRIAGRGYGIQAHQQCECWRWIHAEGKGQKQHQANHATETGYRADPHANKNTK